MIRNGNNDTIPLVSCVMERLCNALTYRAEQVRQVTFAPVCIIVTKMRSDTIAHEVKLKCILYQAMKVHRVNSCIPLLFL